MRPFCCFSFRTEECECGSETILHTRMVPPTQSFSISVYITLTRSSYSSHFHSHKAFVFPLLPSLSILSALLAVLLTRLQFGCHGRDAGVIRMCGLAFRDFLFGESPHYTPTHLLPRAQEGFHSQQRPRPGLKLSICQMRHITLKRFKKKHRFDSN